MASTYTQETLDKAVSQFGNDPVAVRAGIAQSMTAQVPMQEAIGGQATALDKMAQIADYDKQLAGQVTQANQAQMQANQANRATLGAYGSLGATPQETITKAQGALPATEMRAPTQGFLSPFVAEGLTTGEQTAQSGAFDLASQARGSIERAIGTEAQAYADALSYRNQKEQQDLKNAIELAKLTGASKFINPIDGKSYSIKTEQTEAERARALEESIIADIKNPAISLDTIIAKNPQVDPLEIANMNERVWGALKESDADIRSLFGFSPAELTSRKGMTSELTDEKIGYANQLRDEYSNQTKNYREVRDAYNKIENSSDTGVGDISLITAYMKMIDPASSVRETEFANAEEASGYLRKVYNIDAKITKGNRLDPATRKDFMNEAKTIFGTYQTQKDSLTDEYSRLAGEIGVSPSLVIVDMNPEEKIRVRDKSSGVTGTIPASEFNESLYERI